MAARVTHAHFEKFAQARMEFARNVAALAERQEYLEVSHESSYLRGIKIRCSILYGIQIELMLSIYLNNASWFFKLN